MTTETYFGYWRQHADPVHPSNHHRDRGLSWPVVAADPAARASRSFLKKAYAVEASPLVRTLRCKGFSYSRLTGEVVGSTEYTVVRDGVEYHWPDAYVGHYLEAGVPPEPGFVALIDYLHERLALAP